MLNPLTQLLSDKVGNTKSCVRLHQMLEYNVYNKKNNLLFLHSTNVYHVDCIVCSLPKKLQEVC